MHIADGILSGPVLIATGALATVSVGIGLAKMDYERVPRVGVLSAVFFVASLIHVPIGPASAHLLLTGLIGCLLGWAALPALACALLLQAILFGYGGLTSLGANLLVMGLPAVTCYACFGRHIRRASSGRRVFVLAFLAGMLGVGFGCAVLGLVLCASGREFAGAVGAIFVGHIPVMVIEGFITAAALLFLHRVRPELLASPHLDAEREE